MCTIMRTITQAAPVRDVRFVGITFRGAAKTFLSPRCASRNHQVRIGCASGAQQAY